MTLCSFFVHSFKRETQSSGALEQASHLWGWRRLPHNIRGPWVWKVREGSWTLAGGPRAGYEARPSAWSVASSVSWGARAEELALCPPPPRRWSTRPPTRILILSSVPPVQILPPPHSQSVGSFLSELQNSRLLMNKQNLYLPRGAQRQSPILLHPCISVGCLPTWSPSQAPSLGIQSCALLQSPPSLRLGFQAVIRSLDDHNDLMKGLEPGRSRIQSQSLGYQGLGRSPNPPLYPCYMWQHHPPPGSVRRCCEILT